jgi:hypothetical protein
MKQRQSVNHKIPTYRSHEQLPVEVFSKAQHILFTCLIIENFPVAERKFFSLALSDFDDNSNDPETSK